MGGVPNVVGQIGVLGSVPGAERAGFFPSFGLAMAIQGISLRVRFSFCWQTVGAPVSVSISTFRGKCHKENEPTT